MINALNLAVAVGQTAPVFSYPQPQELKPAGELVDARDRFQVEARWHCTV